MLQNKSRRPLDPPYPGWFLWVLTLLGGCTAHYPVNDRIQQAEPKLGYYVDDPRENLKKLATRRSGSLLVVLAFSGGGTRAAAFSYGVLEKLARTEIIWDGRRRRLLDEVDLISSVSGGSFTAAYYGLFGDRIFEDFEDKFLKKDVQSALGALLWSKFPFANSLNSAASVPLNSYNFETLSLIRDLMITWDEDITVGRCWDLAPQGMDQTGCYDMDHVLIEVSFDQIPDEVRRERCERLPTGFRLSVESVDELRQAAADILERSADFKKILRDQLKGPARSVPDR